MRLGLLVASLVLSLLVVSVGANAVYDDFPFWTLGGTITPGGSFVQSFCVDYTATGSAIVTVNWGDGSSFSFSPIGNGCGGGPTTLWYGSFSHAYSSLGSYTGSLSVAGPGASPGTPTVVYFTVLVQDSNSVAVGGGSGHPVRT